MEKSDPHDQRSIDLENISLRTIFLDQHFTNITFETVSGRQAEYKLKTEVGQMQLL